MPTLIFTINPKPGVSLEEFKHFLDTVDRPACLAQPSAITTRVLRVLDKDAPFALIEIFEVISISAGVRGTQILLAPADYLRAVKGTVGMISQDKP